MANSAHVALTTISGLDNDGQHVADFRAYGGANNRNDGAGRLREGEETLLVRAEGAIRTLDDVRAALQGFVGKNGMPAGLELLKEFECARISELSTDQYAAFLARCAA